MKNFLFLLLPAVLFITGNPVSAQNQLNFVDTTNVWYHYGQYGGWGFYPLQRSHLTYYFSGDTVIAGKSYAKMHSILRDTIYSSTPYIQDKEGYSAAFREENNKVYFIIADSTEEKLYADFNIQIGDTLKYYYNNSNYTINTIDSVPFGNTYRKVYNSQGISFYEGIGNELGLFMNFAIGFEGGTYLACFRQKGIVQTVYAFNGTPPPCPLGASGLIEYATTEHIEVYPNPADGYLVFNGSLVAQATNLVLYNSQGQILRQIRNFPADKLTLAIDDFPQGLYFYQIDFDDRGSLSGKVVVE